MSSGSFSSRKRSGTIGPPGAFDAVESHASALSELAAAIKTPSGTERTHYVANGAELSLESHEVVELQAFIERKDWIVEKIKVLEALPPVEMFVGLDAVKRSEVIVLGLPSRAEVQRWVEEHDRIAQETDVFDAGDLMKLKALTKAATHRNLSPQDTDLIELTLTTIYALDKLLHLLRDRAEHLDLMQFRLNWEEKRCAAWIEYRKISDDIVSFLANRARWSPSIYDDNTIISPPAVTPPAVSPSPPSHTLARRSSVVSLNSVSSDLSLAAPALSRGARFKFADALSKEAKDLSNRVNALRHTLVQPAGKMVDKVHAKRALPNEICDEQDLLDLKAGLEMEGVGKFLLALAMQWKKADEFYVENLKDQSGAQSLLGDIELARLGHPTARQNTTFTSRSSTTFKRITARGDPVLSFPQPLHALFPDQPGANDEIVQTLVEERAAALELAQKVQAAAAEYQTSWETVKRVEVFKERVRAQQNELETVTERLEHGTVSTNGDGSPIDLSSERCLDHERHAAYLALLPSTLDAAKTLCDKTSVLLREFAAAAAHLDGDSFDVQFKKDAAATYEVLHGVRKHSLAIQEDVSTRAMLLREARKIWTAVEAGVADLEFVRREISEGIARDTWRPHTHLAFSAPLTPESPLSARLDDDSSPVNAAERLQDIENEFLGATTDGLEAVTGKLQPGLQFFVIESAEGFTGALEALERHTRLWLGVRAQRDAMDAVKLESQQFQLQIESARTDLDGLVEAVLAGELPPSEVQTAETKLDEDFGRLKKALSAFTSRLPTRVPFLSPTGRPAARKRHTLSQELTADRLRHKPSTDPPIDLVMVDSVVRTDCNSFAMTLAGEMQSLLQARSRLALAKMACAMDAALVPVLADIATAEEELAALEAASNQLSPPISLEGLSSLGKDADAIVGRHRARVARSFSPVRQLLHQLETAPISRDDVGAQSIAPSRRKAVDDAESRFARWSEHLEKLQSGIVEARRTEEARLAELQAQEERRQQEDLARLEQERLEAERVERERLEQERLEEERLERERLERVQLERERLEKERLEQERLEQERLEQERLEQECLEQERLERERLEQERLERERLEQERLEQVRLEQERLERERVEQERAERERLEKERLEQERREEERIEKERIEREYLERERLERERLEQKRLEQERLEKERLERERIEKERLEQERLEQERVEQERIERKRLEKERLEQERLEKERLERERLEQEHLHKEQLERERLEKERLERERAERERAEQERLQQERLEQERLERQRLEQERLEQERLEKERREQEHFEQQRLERERAERERLEKERLEQERLEQERLEQERLKQERLEQERLEKERLEQERLRNERLEAKRLQREALETERFEQERLEQEARLCQEEDLRRREEEHLEREQRTGQKHNNPPSRSDDMLSADRRVSVETVRIGARQLSLQDSPALEQEHLDREHEYRAWREQLEREAKQATATRATSGTANGAFNDVFTSQAPGSINLSKSGSHSDIAFPSSPDDSMNTAGSERSLVDDVFGAPGNASLSTGYSAVQKTILSLRMRLQSLSINTIARPAQSSSASLPDQTVHKDLIDALASIVQQVESLPTSDDPLAQVELRSLHLEVESASTMIDRIAKLAQFSGHAQGCDGLLSDLLEHIDSYPAPPIGPLASTYAPSLQLPPEEQLSSRLQHTQESLDRLTAVYEELSDDRRVTSERARLLQTWSELAEMANDRAQGRNSPIASVISESSGRDSRASDISEASVESSQSATPIAPRSYSTPRETPVNGAVPRGAGRGKAKDYSPLSLGTPTSTPRQNGLLTPKAASAPRRSTSGQTDATPRSASRVSTISARSGRSVSASGPQYTATSMSRLQRDTYSSRQRTLSNVSSTSNVATPTRPSPTPVQRPRGMSSYRADTPSSVALSQSSSRSRTQSVTSSSHASSLLRTSTSQRPSWGRPPRSSLGSGRSPQPPAKRREYVANPQNKLDVAVGEVVNQLPEAVEINVEQAERASWKDQSGKYWIGGKEPKLCFCRILRSQTVMVRVGGGWTELSKFIKEHFQDLFRVLPEAPPSRHNSFHMQEKWISSVTLQQLPESPDTPPRAPRTPEPRMRTPTFAITPPPNPGVRSPRGMTATPPAGSPGSPLRAIQFMRRADGGHPTAARPETPTRARVKAQPSGATARAPAWRP